MIKSSLDTELISGVSIEENLRIIIIESSSHGNKRHNFYRRRKGK